MSETLIEKSVGVIFCPQISVRSQVNILLELKLNLVLNNLLDGLLTTANATIGTLNTQVSGLTTELNIIKGNIDSWVNSGNNIECVSMSGTRKVGNSGIIYRNIRGSKPSNRYI